MINKLKNDLSQYIYDLLLSIENLNITGHNFWLLMMLL